LQNGVWHVGRFILNNWFSLECQGIENVPNDRAYLIAANHSSHLDGPAIIAAHNKHLKNVYSFAASDYFFNHPLKEKVFGDILNMISFSRKGISRNCIPICRNLLDENKAILIFPEGTRSHTGKINKFRPGFGFLAMELGVPIIPAYISGSYQALPKGSIFPKKHPIRVTFGPLIDIEQYQAQKTRNTGRIIYQSIVDDVYSNIKSLCDE
jgi:long-chain acyl-CoA synthetase